jgi:hypothetical protein
MSHYGGGSQNPNAIKRVAIDLYSKKSNETGSTDDNKKVVMAPTESNLKKL